MKDLSITRLKSLETEVVENPKSFWSKTVVAPLVAEALRNRLKLAAIQNAIEGTAAWLEEDDTWDNALDGLDAIDCCHAALGRIREALEKGATTHEHD